ncbi:MAG: hypothetical protein OEZ34_10305 [Spirochaetia bacterium]|nr:hypothetical protein [Spirochaetia bacterium]
MQQQEQASLKTILIVLFATLAVILIPVLTYRYFSGGITGEDCSDSIGCRPGYYCTFSYCTEKCEQDSDCPENWQCRDLSISRERLGIEYDAGEVKMCVR